LSGRYGKTNGALLLEPPGRSDPSGPMRRFKPDFYVPPPEKPARQPNFHQTPRSTPGFGRGAGKRGGPTPRFKPTGRLGPVGWVSVAGILWWAVEMVDGLMLTRPVHGQHKTPPGWVLCRNVCDTPPVAPHVWTNNAMKWNLNWHCSPDKPCIDGQGNTGTGYEYEWDFTVSDAESQIGTYYRYNVGGGGVVRLKHHRSYKRVGGGGPRTWRYMASMWQPWDDPNDKRRSPSPAPFPPPQSGHSNGGGAPPSNDFAPPRNSNPKRPKRPDRGTKERKQKTKLTTMFKILDLLSESAELVGSFYDALPEDVRKKWKCDKLKRGLLDSAGQYGISGADCKARALWHNWHRVDFEKAIRNAVKNELQDKFLGALNRAQPKNIGHASDEAMKELNKLFEQVMEELGL